MTDRFDAQIDGDYATCITCSIPLPTEEGAREHMTSTFEASQQRQGHSIRQHHRSRAERIESAVSYELESALQDLFQAVDELVMAEDITEDEATTALRTLHFDIDDEYEHWKEQ